jgi:hypothetical protein
MRFEVNVSPEGNQYWYLGRQTTLSDWLKSDHSIYPKVINMRLNGVEYGEDHTNKTC